MPGSLEGLTPSSVFLLGELLLCQSFPVSSFPLAFSLVLCRFLSYNSPLDLDIWIIQSFFLSFCILSHICICILFSTSSYFPPIFSGATGEPSPSINRYHRLCSYKSNAAFDLGAFSIRFPTLVAQRYLLFLVSFPPPDLFSISSSRRRPLLEPPLSRRSQNASRGMILPATNSLPPPSETTKAPIQCPT